jgi:hypothetical protein
MSWWTDEGQGEILVVLQTETERRGGIAERARLDASASSASASRGGLGVSSGVPRNENNSCLGLKS